MNRRVSQSKASRRRTVSELIVGENATEIRLSELVNFGPVTLREFEAMGFKVFGQLEELGWEEVCRRWVEHFPERLNVNAFIGVIATLEGIPWTKVSASDRAKAKKWVHRLREELGPTAPRSSRTARPSRG